MFTGKYCCENNRYIGYNTKQINNYNNWLYNGNHMFRKNWISEKYILNKKNCKISNLKIFIKVMFKYLT